MVAIQRAERKGVYSTGKVRIIECKSMKGDREMISREVWRVYCRRKVGIE
jgi:hypothetical protein